MSIDPILSQLLQANKLFELASLLTGDETVRTMIVSADVMAVVSPPFADTEEGLRHGELRAWMDAFSEGAELTVAEDPDRKPPDAMLARVHNVDDEFWSIRVTEPEDTAGIRSLGAFAAKDKFLALTWEYREDMTDFDSHVQGVQQDWDDLFGSEPPFFGDRLDEYLTNYRAV